MIKLLTLFWRFDTHFGRLSTTNVDASIARCENSIELLKEFKEALKIEKKDQKQLNRYSIIISLQGWTVGGGGHSPLDTKRFARSAVPQYKLVRVDAWRRSVIERVRAKHWWWLDDSHVRTSCSGKAWQFWYVISYAYIMDLKLRHCTLLATVLPLQLRSQFVIIGNSSSRDSISPLYFWCSSRVRSWTVTFFTQYFTYQSSHIQSVYLISLLCW